MSVRPLVLWATRQKGMTLRFTRRDAEVVEGLLTGPGATLPFSFERAARTLRLPDWTLQLDEYGWEVDEEGQIVFRSGSAG